MYNKSESSITNIEKPALFYVTIDLKYNIIYIDIIYIF